MKNNRLWILLAGVALMSAAFLFLNFRVAVSNTQAAKLITTMGNNASNPMQRNDKLRIVLVGEGPLVRALEKALAKQMDEAGLGESEVMGELEPAYQNPVLLVKVGQPDPIWTPFFAMSKFAVHAGYASNGDTNFMKSIEETHTSIASSDPLVFNMYAEYEVNDRSLGLISRPGYHQYLADYLAHEIVVALTNPHNR